MSRRREPVDERTRQRVGKARVGRLATVRPDGQPHAVVCCFALEGDTVYSAVDHKPKSTARLQRLRNLEANPAACLLVDHYVEDWTALWWIRLDGVGRILDEGPEQARAVAALAAKYDQYRRQPPAGPVIALDVDHWTAWP